MYFSNKMLEAHSRNVGMFVCISAMLATLACHKEVEPTKVRGPLDTAKVDIFFKDFESTSPVSLNDDALKSASDLRLSLTDEKRIDRIKREIAITACQEAGNVNDVGDMRLLIEFRTGEKVLRVWRSSQFYFQSGNQGKICELSPEDKRRLESLLKSI